MFSRDQGEKPQFRRVTQGTVEQRMLNRPSIGVRTRLSLGFITLFILASSVAGAAWVMLSRLDKRMLFLETADRYTMEIQQARRFEKNYFLYGTNLIEMREHLHAARALLLAARPEAGKVLSRKDATLMEEHLDRYEELVDRLGDNGTEGASRPRIDPKVEQEIREYGSEMVSFALNLARQERLKVNATMKLFKHLTVIFLVTLVIIMVLIGHFLARQTLEPLNRLMATARRIAMGDFTPMTPARWYRDEFSDLAVALNTMMKELAHRHEVLVESHKMKAVGTLTAGVAHELNNPINNITLTAEVLKEDYSDLSDEERLDMVNDLVNEAERSHKIVRNLLDFARESEIHAERLDLADLLEKTVELAANQVKMSGAKISLQLPDNLPPIHGDFHSLCQVFLNLVLNALDAVDKGGQVTLKAEGERVPGKVHIIVRDNGKGIPSSSLNNVFDPFFTTKSTGKGTGLGLSVSMGIVRQHGGEISVESKVGEGSTFTVVLPAAMIPEV